MRFFLDNCLSDRLVKAVCILDPKNEIVHLRNKFSPDTEDVIWIQTLGQEGGWVIVSGDPRISRHQEERRAWRESGLTAFFSPAGIPKSVFGSK